MPVYITDTHPLVWYTTGTHRHLSPKVLRAFHAASGAEALIYVPAFVLWEIAMLLKVGRIALHQLSVIRLLQLEPPLTTLLC